MIKAFDSNGIQAFHSNWTKPFFLLNRDIDYYIEDFEILTTILSALKWREFNGSIKMVTDEIGESYYKSLGIESIWDMGIDNTLNNEIDKEIDPFLFWAAGKICALKKQNTPIAMIDTDFIVWKSLETKLKDLELCTIHSENISPDIYPYKNYFYMKKGYKFDDDWDWEVLPCNTAFTYISDEKLHQYYTQESIRFMTNVVKGKDRITNMVFAEQRMISMCAKKMNIPIHNLSDLAELESGRQTYFTHIWGYKDVLREDFDKTEEFCIKCIKRIINDFPEYKSMLENVKPLQLYFKKINS